MVRSIGVRRSPERGSKATTSAPMRPPSPRSSAGPADHRSADWHVANRGCGSRPAISNHSHHREGRRDRLRDRTAVRSRGAQVVINGRPRSRSRLSSARSTRSWLRPLATTWVDVPAGTTPRRQKAPLPRVSLPLNESRREATTALEGMSAAALGRNSRRPTPASEPSVERATPETTTERASPEAATARASPEAATARASPEAITERASPEAITERAIPEAITERASPEAITERASPEAITERASPETTTERASPEAATARASPETITE